MDVVVFPNHHYLLLERLNQMRLSGRLCDIRFRIGDAVFPAHRLVLAAQAHLLRQLFNIDILRFEEDEIVVHNIDAQALRQALDFIYLGRESVSKVPAA